MGVQALHGNALPLDLFAYEDRFPQRGERWYAVYAGEGREEAESSKLRKVLAGDALSDCFVPRLEKYVRRDGAWQLASEPMFKGYFFVATRDMDALSEELAKLSWHVPVAGRGPQGYAHLSDEVRRFLANALDGNHVLRASEGVIEGGELAVSRGPLRGRERSVRKINRHKRMAWLGLSDRSDACVLRAALNVSAKS